MRKLITDKTPDQLKMPYALWSRAAVGELIEQRFGVRLPVRTMGLYLSRWGFTPQKPMKKAYEQSPAAVKKWLEEEYPVIAACAKVQGAEIHWGDETGLRSDDVRGRSYAPRGETPVVRVNSKRRNHAGQFAPRSLTVDRHPSRRRPVRASHRSRSRRGQQASPRQGDGRAGANLCSDGGTAAGAPDAGECANPTHTLTTQSKCGCGTSGNLPRIPGSNTAEHFSKVDHRPLALTGTVRAFSFFVSAGVRVPAPNGSETDRGPSFPATRRARSAALHLVIRFFARLEFW